MGVGWLLQAPDKDTMSERHASRIWGPAIRGTTIWVAIAVMLTGVSLLFGFWGVVVIAAGAGLAVAVLDYRD